MRKPTPDSSLTAPLPPALCEPLMPALPEVSRRGPTNTCKNSQKRSEAHVYPLPRSASAGSGQRADAPDTAGAHPPRRPSMSHRFQTADRHTDCTILSRHGRGRIDTLSPQTGGKQYCVVVNGQVQHPDIPQSPPAWEGLTHFEGIIGFACAARSAEGERRPRLQRTLHDIAVKETVLRS
jgi:hypothetical protein